VGVSAIGVSSVQRFVRGEHNRDGAGAHVLVRPLGADQIAPAGSAEDILAEGQRVPEIVLLHDPGGAQAAAVQVVLNVILFQHDLLQDFREGVAAGIGGVPLLLGHRDRVGIEEVSQAGVAADEQELLEGGALAARLQ